MEKIKSAPKIEQTRSEKDIEKLSNDWKKEYDESIETLVELESKRKYIRDEIEKTHNRIYKEEKDKGYHYFKYKDLPTTHAFNLYKMARKRLDFLNSELKKLEQVETMSKKNILPTRKSVEGLQTLALTTQKQTALFAYYLRKEKMLLPNLSNTLLAKCFGEMNDYSPQQIQKLFDGAKNVSDISQKKEDFHTLISALQNLKDAISRELAENIKSKTVK